ncbi:MAG: EF-P lysine aminoacylase EpmA [Pseudomonadota bacterium]
MSWNPTASLAAARQRAAATAAIRTYFAAREVLEVQTPALGATTVTDPNIESLQVNAPLIGRAFYLQTSPEYAMKRLLAAGYPDIYQIATVYRDGEIGHRHQPEFTLLEWYRHGFDLAAIIADTLALLTALLSLPGSAITLTAKPDSGRWDDLLAGALGVTSDSPTAALQEHVDSEFPPALRGDHDALCDWLFDQHVARHFAPDRLSVVSHYPASQAALAELDPASNKALRFEVYCGALELANGFVELTDAHEQRERFAEDLAKRRARAAHAPPVDEAFLAALTAGLPQCAGVAVGLERVLMLIGGQQDIRNVISFAQD